VRPVGVQAFLIEFCPLWLSIFHREVTRCGSSIPEGARGVYQQIAMWNPLTGVGPIASPCIYPEVSVSRVELGLPACSRLMVSHKEYSSIRWS